MARLLPIQVRNMAFVASATDGCARAISAIPWREGDVILTTNNDYASNPIAFLSLQKRFGIRLVCARDLPTGGIDVDDFERLVRQHRPLCAILKNRNNRLRERYCF